MDSRAANRLVNAVMQSASAIASKVMRFTGLTWVYAKVFDSVLSAGLKVPTCDAGGEMVRRIDAWASAQTDNLLRGDLLAASMERYPATKYPEMYKALPEDLERSIISHGRLITGEFRSHLGRRLLDTNKLDKLFQASLNRIRNARYKSISLAYVVVVPMLAISLGGAATALSVNSIQRAQIHVAQLTPLDVTLSKHDVWDRAEIDHELVKTVAEEQRKAGERGSNLGSMAAAASFLNALFIAFGISIIWFAIDVWRQARFSVANSPINKIINSDTALTTETHEEIVLWKRQLLVREAERNAYIKQLVEAENDKSPRVILGRGTGLALYRGVTQGYKPGQAIEISIEDMYLNSVIMAGTGAGKSFGVLTPMTVQIARILKAASDDRSFSLAAFCGKGVFQHDAMNIAKALGVNCQVIGVGEGEFGVDLYGGLSPAECEDTLNSAFQQVRHGGEPQDPYWSDMASKIRRCSLAIAQAFELTPLGEEMIRNTGERLYSPVWQRKIAKSIQEPDGLARRAVDEIFRCIEDTEDAKRLAGLSIATLIEDIETLTIDIASKDPKTVEQYLNHVTEILDLFSDDQVRKFFGTASMSVDRVLDINDLWRNRTMTTFNLTGGRIGEVCARTLSIFLKIRTYMQAAKRERLDRSIRYKSSLGLLMDEFQLLATDGGQYSDAEFFNRSRSTGTFLVAVTQGVAALMKVFGETSGGPKTMNLLAQMRGAKIFLPTEEQETIKYIEQLFGQTPRWSCTDYDQFENMYHAQRERGETMTDLISPLALSDDEIDRLCEDGNFDESIGLVRKSIIKEDWRFYDSSLEGDKVDWIAKQQEISNRAEDKRREVLNTQHQTEPVISQSDLYAMGRGVAAVFITRAGHNRMDVIELMPELGKTEA